MADTNTPRIKHYESDEDQLLYELGMDPESGEPIVPGTELADGHTVQDPDAGE